MLGWGGVSCEVGMRGLWEKCKRFGREVWEVGARGMRGGDERVEKLAQEEFERWAREVSEVGTRELRDGLEWSERGAREV